MKSVDKLVNGILDDEGGSILKIKKTILLCIMVSLFAVYPVFAERTPAPKDAEVYIIWPSDGKVIHGGKLWVRMGLRGAGVAPRGADMPNVGHHHLIVDQELPPFDQVIPSDRNYLHFGGGQTEVRLEGLTPGKHTLQLLMGDNNHIPHDPPLYSKKITIIVPPY